MKLGHYFHAFVWVSAIGLQSLSAWAEPLELVSLTNLWRYNQTGADLGTAWKEFDYDDSSWSQGLGALASDTAFSGGPELVRTTLTRLGTNGQFIITDYFRTRFTLESIIPLHGLAFSILVDDGAVVYLNGVELFRQYMPPGPVTAITFASRTFAVSEEGVFEEVLVPPTALRVGENVLAVEVHQPYVTSSDVTLGLVLTYADPGPLSFTQQPADVTAAEYTQASWSAGVSGADPHFQWFKDEVPIPGATQSGYSLPSVTRSHAGQYWVQVTNAQAAVTSRVATLTVVLDTNSPTLVAASRSASSTVISLDFSEALEASSASNKVHYSVRSGGGNVFNILTVTYSADGFFGGTRVSITTVPLPPGPNYFVSVSHVQDRQGNPILPDSRIGIRTDGLVPVPLESQWRYNDSGLEPETGWGQPDFNDSAWPAGPALLYNDVNFSPQSPGVARTLMAVTNALGEPIVTHYLRHHFTNAINPLGARLSLRFFADDGMVAYLNGQELYRAAMPQGPVNATTRAVIGLNEGMYTNSPSLDGTHLVLGHNVLAVEVHQRSLASPVLPDVSFGMQIEASAASFIAEPPVFLVLPSAQTVLEQQSVIFSAQVMGAQSYQWRRDGSPIDGATEPSFTVPLSRLTDDGALFSLVAGNESGAVESPGVRLTVLADMEDPRLVTAVMGTNLDLVVVTFSETVDPSTANQTGFYQIIDSAGHPLNVLSATLTNGTHVVLQTLPRTNAGPFILTVTGVRDTSVGGNEISRHNQVTLQVEGVLVAYEHVWRYDDTGTDRGTAWREADYDDSTWPSGQGLLGFEDLLLGEPLRTVLVPPEFRGPTYYFRTWFTLPPPVAGGSWRLQHYIDDGMVLFLNGVEVYRIRVPHNQTAATLATQATEAFQEGPFEIPASALVPGPNVLAAEVHQIATTSADTVFGLRLVQTSPSVALDPVRPRLSLGWRGDPWTLTWDQPGYVLETAASVQGPWQPAPRPTLPYPLMPGSTPAFYRLRAEQR